MDKSEAHMVEMSPGVERWQLVSSEQGAQSLTVADLTLAPESTVATHIHPTEEAMVILEGELEAVIGDAITTVSAGQTVLAQQGSGTVS